MFPRLLLLFTIIPAIELYLLISVGSVIGAGYTFLIIIATGIFGAHYARQQGFDVMVRLQRAQREGRMPADEMVDGAMLLLGGAFLITPGFLTDIVGFSLVFPPTRNAYKRRFAEWMRRKIEDGDIVVRHY
ncbi:MAG: membrane protein FxsA [Deltaproteobacteria bacterium]|nr:MAG: membrane protein FxsA [Deltaproteobacteria bacterium]